MSEAEVRAAALALPGAYEQSSYEGRPTWRTKPRIFAAINPQESALVVWVDSEEEKGALIVGDPDTYFTTSHYDGYAIVLAHLSAVDAATAAELITDSWRLRAPRSLVRRWEEEQA